MARAIGVLGGGGLVLGSQLGLGIAPGGPRERIDPLVAYLVRVRAEHVLVELRSRVPVSLRFHDDERVPEIRAVRQFAVL